MSNFPDRSPEIFGEEIDATQHRRPSGLIVFCERNLRYEKGQKAWIFLGPYLLGAFALEIIFNDGAATRTNSIALWIAFLGYVILFPILWRRFLSGIRSSNTGTDAEKRSAASRPQ